MSSKADRSKIPEQHHVSFNLQPNDFQPKRTAIASHQGASAFRNLFHAWFNVSFRMFSEKDPQKIDLVSNSSILGAIMKCTDLFKKYTLEHHPENDSFINYKGISLDLESFDRIGQQQWLKDDSISIFLDALNMTQDHTDSFNKLARSYCFNSLTFAQLMQIMKEISKSREKQFALKFKDFIANRTFSSHIYSILANYPGIRDIHFVVNIDNAHYCVLSTDLIQQQVVSTDPYTNQDNLIPERSLFAKLVGVISQVSKHGNTKCIYLGKKDVKEKLYSSTDISPTRPSFSHTFRSNFEMKMLGRRKL